MVAFELSVQAWIRKQEELLSNDLFVLEPYVVDTYDGYIAFTCPAFATNPNTFGEGDLCVGTDAKVSTLRGGWRVATMGFLAKDGLRNTTLFRAANGRAVQMPASTSRFFFQWSNAWRMRKQNTSLRD